MRANYKVELTSGVFILLGIAALLWLATQATDYGQNLGDETYTINASFTNVADLKLRSPVKIGGVAVGLVEKIVLDPVNFEALVTMQIDARFNEIPMDTSAAILTSGVLGDRYVGLEPGGSYEYLVEGDQLIVTQSAVVLEELVSKYLFNTGKADESGAE
jgi:phospholipid/cholesterol/gamma-HCH transport system substrate-binding protein